MAKPLMRWVDYSGGSSCLLLGYTEVAHIHCYAPGGYEAYIEEIMTSRKGFNNIHDAKNYCEQEILKYIKEATSIIQEGVESRHISEW